MRAVELIDPGSSALPQDLGRPGHAHLGVAPSGALDQSALRLANRLVGNREGAAGVESLLGGLTLRAHGRCAIAVTGPPARLWLDGRPMPSHTPLRLRHGQTLRLGVPDTGLRCYLAFSGGLAVNPELGSRSTDVLSGIGPAPLRSGDLLPLDEPHGAPAGVDAMPVSTSESEIDVPVLPGPREEWFADPAGGLARARTVTADSDRVGLRLTGPPLLRADAFVGAELPSEAVLTGAIQVPPDGAPLVFLADHPTTGGYPVIGVVVGEALPRLAQARPGNVVRLQMTCPDNRSYMASANAAEW